MKIRVSGHAIPGFAVNFNDYMSTFGLPKLTKIRTIVDIEAMKNRALEITFEEIEALTAISKSARLRGTFPTGEFQSCTVLAFSSSLSSVCAF